MKKTFIALTTAFLMVGGLSISAAHADTLLINSAFEKPEEKRPTRGQTMDQVTAEFGKPSSVSGPVGEPPITTWDYPGFSVYFEYDKVLHSVMQRDKEETEE